MSGPRRSRESPFVNASALVTSIVSALAGVTAVVFSTFEFKEPASLLVILVPIILVGVFAILMFRRLYRVVDVSLIVALGGAPGAGKTVFANVLCSALTEQESEILSFLPETATAQQVYRTTGRLRKGGWPKSTGTDRIDRYRGKIGFRRGLGLLRLLRFGRVEFELEIGDSAGEIWEDLAEEVSSNVVVGEAQRQLDEGLHRSPVRRLIDSTFFEYVGDADALLYFIACDVLIDEPDLVAEFVEDLISTIQILRIVEGVGPAEPLRRPVGVIFSKADMLQPVELQALAVSVKRDPGEPGPPLLDDPEGRRVRTLSRSLFQVERLHSVLRRQCKSYVPFVISALSTVAVDDAGAPVRRERGIAPTSAPAEWIFMDLWRRRRFRGR